MKKILIAATLISNSGCGVLMTVKDHTKIVNDYKHSLTSNDKEIKKLKNTVTLLNSKSVILNGQVKRLESSLDEMSSRARTLKNLSANWASKYNTLNHSYVSVLNELQNEKLKKTKQIEFDEDNLDFLEVYLLTLEKGKEGLFNRYAEDFTDVSNSSKMITDKIKSLYTKILKTGKKTVFELNTDFNIVYNKKVLGQVNFNISGKRYSYSFIIKNNLKQLKNSGDNFGVGVKIKNDRCHDIEEEVMYDKYGDEIIDTRTFEPKTKKVKKYYDCLSVVVKYLLYNFDGKLQKYEI